MNARHATRCAVAALTAALVLSSLPASALGGVRDADPMDWPYWRGPEMNGISREKNIVAEWSPRSGENVLWKRDDLGGRSTPIVMDGRLYTIVNDKPGTPQEGEKVVCLDPKTGETLWENSFNVFLSDVPAERVGWSSVAGDPETGNLFVLGVCDLFRCIDGETGETLWEHSLSEEYGFLNTYGGRTNFPIVHKNLVIISAVVIGWGEMAKPAHRFVAFDKRNGQAVWFESTRLLPYDTTYSAPTLTVIDGEPMMIFGSGDGGVHAFQPQTGQNIWSYYISRRGINTAPLVVGDKVFCGHGQENLGSTEMGALFALDASREGKLSAKKGELWRKNGWAVGRAAPLHIDGRLYAITNGANLLVVNPENGKLIAEQKLGTEMHSSPVYADGKIFCGTVGGRWYTLEPTEDGVEIVHRTRLRGASLGSPIVSHGRLYVPSSRALYCVGKKDQEPQADERPEVPDPAPITEHPEPAHLQLAPVESLLQPGQKQKFQVRLYNEYGQFLRMAKPADVEFTVKGPGSFDKKGRYVTPEKDVHAAVYVTAKVGDLTGDARIRLIPDLPWEFDFDTGEVPVTWVGARYRHIALDFDLLQALKKQDERAGQLYIYLMTSFINSGKSELVFDDTTPRNVWKQLRRFLGVVQEVRNLEQAKEHLDPSLQILKDKKVLASWNWKELEGGDVRLTVNRGSRKVAAGNGVMTKITTIPKGARSRGWIGRPDLHDYTIQADVRGAVKHKQIPGIGLLAQRYAIEMMGAQQKIEVRTWPTVFRMGESTPFEWKPDTWYTMKFQVSNQEDTTLVRGKIWPRDGKEPKEWTIQATDPRPNRQGSPGLFGDARNAEIFYDNLKVYPNGESAKQVARGKQDQ